MNGCFAPLKGGGVDVVDLDETIDGVSHLVRRSEAYAFQRSATEDVLEAGSASKNAAFMTVPKPTGDQRA